MFLILWVIIVPTSLNWKLLFHLLHSFLIWLFHYLNSSCLLNPKCFYLYFTVPSALKRLSAKLLLNVDYGCLNAGSFCFVIFIMRPALAITGEGLIKYVWIVVYHTILWLLFCLLCVKHFCVVLPRGHTLERLKMQPTFVFILFYL